MCRLSWFLDPGGWSKAAVVGLYFIFPGIYTLSLPASNSTAEDQDINYALPDDLGSSMALNFDWKDV
ncbi:hypothetical protein STEG23_028329 [Scotinomys teguina]